MIPKNMFKEMIHAMRKLITLTLTLALLLSLVPPGPAVADQNTTTVVFTIGSTIYTVNDTPHSMDAAPFINPQTSRTYVPVRFLAEALGASVNWDPQTQTVTLVDGGTTEQMVIGNPTLTVNGQAQTMDTAPMIVPPGRTELPARFVAQTFGYIVGWNPMSQAMTITNGSNVGQSSSYSIKEEGYDPYGQGSIYRIVGAIASGDGAVIFCDNNDNVFRWTVSGGLQKIGVNPYPTPSGFQWAHYPVGGAALGDGSVLFHDDIDNVFRWTTSGGLQKVGLNPYDSPGDHAINVVSSAAAPGDGSVLFGDDYGDVFRWTALNGLQKVGHDPYGLCQVQTATAVGNGSVLFGDEYGRAFLWTSNGSLVKAGVNPWNDPKTNTFYGFDAAVQLQNGEVWLVASDIGAIEPTQFILWKSSDGFSVVGSYSNNDLPPWVNAPVAADSNTIWFADKNNIMSWNQSDGVHYIGSDPYGGSNTWIYSSVAIGSDKVLFGDSNGGIFMVSK